MEQSLLPREDTRLQTQTPEFQWARWARLGMGFGATLNAGFSTMGLGLTIGWLACGPAHDTCTHHPTERFEQIIPPALGIGLLQGVLFRRVTGTQGDETGYENAIALYMPVNVSPRQAFQSLFAVALGWVVLAFPVFLSVVSTSWTNPLLPQIPTFNPLVLTPDWSYTIIVAWSMVLVVGMWGWVNAPRATTAGLALPRSDMDRATGVVSFFALVMFGYSTGLPTLCAANSLALAGTTTWQTRLGYPDVGCAGAFTGVFQGSGATGKYVPDSDGNFYAGTGFWLWAAGWIAWIVLTVVGLILQVVLLYRRAAAEAGTGRTLGDRKKERLPVKRTFSVEAPGRLGGGLVNRTQSRSRSWSEPDDRGPDLTGSPQRDSASPTSSSGNDRAGILVAKWIMGVVSLVVLAGVFCSLGFMLSGDAIYDIDYRMLVLAAVACLCITCVLAVAAAHGVRGPDAVGDSADGWRSLNLNAQVSDTPGAYKLFVCDRVFTWALTAMGTIAIAAAAVAAMATASHLQPDRISYQDTLGLNPFSTGFLHYVIFAGVLLAGTFALMFDTAHTEHSRRRRNAGSLTFFIMLSMLLCVGISLSVSSSLSIFITMVCTLAVVNGLCYSLAIHRSTLPSRRYTAFTVVLVLCGSCGLLYLSAAVVGTVIPPWGCPTAGSPGLAAGPPWACIDLTAPAPVNPTTVYYQVTPPLVAIITLFLLALAVIAGGRWDAPSLNDTPVSRAERLYVYPPTVLPTYGQPLFWIVITKVLFFCFFANFLGELMNLRSCEVVDMWDWTTCGPPHDIALDLMGTASMVGFFVTLFNFPEICQKGVMLGKVQPVDERILERWLLRPWATGAKVKALREFVLVRAALMGFCTTLYIGLPTVMVMIIIGPEKQLPFGPAGISWLGIVPRFWGFGWWDGTMARWTFVWFKSVFAVTVGLVCVVVGYAAGTSRLLLKDITARTQRLEKATLAELLPHPVHLVSTILFVSGCVIGSVGAACLNDTLYGTTCTYTQSVILLSVGWPAVGVAIALEMALPHVPMLLESWTVAMAARLPDVAEGTESLDSLTGSIASIPETQDPAAWNPYPGSPAAAASPQREPLAVASSSSTAGIGEPQGFVAVAPALGLSVAEPFALGLGVGLATPRTPMPLPQPPSLGATEAEVCTWLRAIGLGEHCRAFLRNHIDGEALRELVEDDGMLKSEVGIASFGHRSRLKRALAGPGATPRRFAGEPAPAPLGPAEPTPAKVLEAAKEAVGGSTHKAIKKLYSNLKSEPDSAAIKAAIAMAEAEESGARDPEVAGPEPEPEPVDVSLPLEPQESGGVGGSE